MDKSLRAGVGPRPSGWRRAARFSPGSSHEGSPTDSILEADSTIVSRLMAQGVCMINDVAVRSAVCSGMKRFALPMTVDCDVHHGMARPPSLPEHATPGGPLPSTPAPAGVRRQPRGASLAQQSCVNAPAGDVFTISCTDTQSPEMKPPSSIDVDCRMDGRTTTGLARQRRSGHPVCDHLRRYALLHRGRGSVSRRPAGRPGVGHSGGKERDELVFRAARARKHPVMVPAPAVTPKCGSTVTNQTHTVLARKRVRLKLPRADR